VSISGPIVDAFRSRALDSYYPLIAVDAIYLKVREDIQPISMALYVAIGTNTEGKREVLGFHLSKTESEIGYQEFFADLKTRGIKRVDFCVSDNHAGLVAAIRESFGSIIWQRCQTHFSRNMKDACSSKVWEEVRPRLTDIYTAPDEEQARERKEALVLDLEKTAPKAAKLLDEAFDDIIAVMVLPEKYRVKYLNLKQH